ncbi:MAG TPA: alpha/beta hydrolase [Thermoleophilaceae bacterium]|nr:alpha/beta hydrolase [Thermoleophilaceae bacterium]
MSDGAAISPEATPFEVPLAGGGRLVGELAGSGTTIALLHGLTASRRYVVHGSRYLERHGHRLVGYDARGHGASSAAPAPDAYEYGDLVEDLVRVLDDLELERCVLAGSSMGAATALAFTLARPERVDALVQITPASSGGPSADADELERWERLASGLRERGVEGFLAAYDPPVNEHWRDAVMTATRQRLETHSDLDALADALEIVPRSTAFEGGIAALPSLRVPTLVVGSRDSSDPSHPLAIAEDYADALPRAELVVEDEGDSPLAWQGAQVSRTIAGFLERVMPQEGESAPS